MSFAHFPTSAADCAEYLNTTVYAHGAEWHARCLEAVGSAADVAVIAAVTVAVAAGAIVGAISALVIWRSDPRS